MSMKSPTDTLSIDWLTDEDLAWRPKIEAQELNWKQLKSLREYEKKVPSQRITEPVGIAQQRLIQNDVKDQLMRLCFATMGRANKPKSVTFCAILHRLHLPTLGLSWRQYLGFRMLHWEFLQWAQRIMDQSGLSRDWKIDTLLQNLPQIGGKPDRSWPHRNIPGEPTNAEAAILWRWAVARGKKMNQREWVEFTSRFAGVP